MKQSWNNLGIKDKIQYITAVILITSGILIAFLSFLLIHVIESGVLIYIAQTFITGGAIFGVSIYFKSKLGEFESKAATKITDKLEEIISKEHNETEGKKNS